MSFEGIPAIYFNSIFGTANDETKFIITGNNRDVNRYRWNFKNIINKLKDNKTKQSIFFNNICNFALVLGGEREAIWPQTAFETLPDFERGWPRRAIRALQTRLTQPIGANWRPRAVHGRAWEGQNAHMPSRNPKSKKGVEDICKTFSNFAQSLKTLCFPRLFGFQARRKPVHALQKAP